MYRTKIIFLLEWLLTFDIFYYHIISPQPGNGNYEIGQT